MFDFEKIAYYLNDFNGLELEDIQEVIELFKKTKLEPDEIFIKEGSSKKKVAILKKA